LYEVASYQQGHKQNFSKRVPFTKKGFLKLLETPLGMPLYQRWNQIGSQGSFRSDLLKMIQVSPGIRSPLQHNDVYHSNTRSLWSMPSFWDHTLLPATAQKPHPIFCAFIQCAIIHLLQACIEPHPLINCCCKLPGELPLQ